MSAQFEAVLLALLQPDQSKAIFDPAVHFDPTATEPAAIAQSLNAAFLITLAGPKHPAYDKARAYLENAQTGEAQTIASFYLNGLQHVRAELDNLTETDPDFAKQLNDLAEWTSHSENLTDKNALAEHTWSVFFPEAVGIKAGHEQSVKALRAKRTVTIDQPASPITDPARSILFTSNVLLTTPAANEKIEDLPYTEDLKSSITQSLSDRQLYWYDHPIQIGVEVDKNEIIYGLRGLNNSMEAEKERGNLADGQKVKCLLSVSVTHQTLQAISRQYLEEELARSGELQNLEVYAFSEADTQRIVDEVLVPAAERFLDNTKAAEMLKVFGVDGEYGRHYSFLKAVLGLWNILIEPEVTATFKIDLDQIFAQKELVEQAGASALEHFKTSLWGAQATDSAGQPVELGMIAGALVNERDIHKSLFYPDVLMPERALTPDEFVFFSTMPQALSTEAEMMTRYNTPDMDGQTHAIQRIHVTGGTNGILSDSLRKYRAFTPSFIGRAEDQAFILSVLLNDHPRLAYLHKDGLIMRHDKEAFAYEAIAAAATGKMVGDYIRTLYFSAYARALSDGHIERIKTTIDPFTGCFVSRLPITVVHLRFALKAATFYTSGKASQGHDFIANGAPRLTDALAFTQGDHSQLAQTYLKERDGWQLYYDVLDALEKALADNHPSAAELRDKAQAIISDCHLHS